ncbi:MAG: YfhO family protein, partial [Thermoanaerobaculales bacterium]|nr:YfhO family protein [Thermoanaerobaculales bacterium]
AIRGSRKVPQGLQRVRSPGDGMQLVRNQGALRRFFIAPSAEVVPRADVIASVAGLQDPRRVVIAAEDLGDWRPPERPWVPRAARVEHMDPGKIDLAVPERGEKLLATSLTVPEGWHVTAAGQRLRTVTINGAFLGAVIPAGVDRVSLRFMPPWLRLGVLLSVISVGVLIGGAFVSTRRHRCPQ